MSLTGKGKIAGIIGWPVTHSVSPVLHGYWLKEWAIDGAMIPLAVRAEDFATVIDAVRRAGFVGVNVTVPHKEAAFALAHKSSDEAKIAGAANLLIFHDDGHIYAENTDAFGLRQSLNQELGANVLHGKKAIILGAGGAARAAALALNSPLGATPIHILNRNIDRARNLVKHLSEAITMPLLTGTFDDWPDVAKDAALVVNATSAGMAGVKPLVLDLEPLPTTAVVCDVVYNPLDTDLLVRAKARGNKTIDGLGMLMHQAAPSFRAFFGPDPQVTRGLRETLIEALNAR